MWAMHIKLVYRIHKLAALLRHKDTYTGKPVPQPRRDSESLGLWPPPGPDQGTTNIVL